MKKQFKKKWFAEFSVQLSNLEYIVPVAGIYATKEDARKALDVAVSVYMDTLDCGCTLSSTLVYQRLTRI